MKEVLSSEFDTKDLRAAKKILGITILRNKSNFIMKLYQAPYLQKVIARFSMENAKEVTVPLRGHFKLSADQCPSTEQEMEDMLSVPNHVHNDLY